MLYFPGINKSEFGGDNDHAKVGRFAFLLLPASAVAPTAGEEVSIPPVDLGSESSEPPVVAAQGSTLIGLFRINKGTCTAGGVTSGSYFRMYDPGGDLVTNGSSPCGDKTFTALPPGTDGEISTVGYQPHPTPEFDGSGNGTNAKFTEPEAFYGTRFATATNARDPQTNTNVSAPEILHDGAGKLSGDVGAFAAAWQNQHFNQAAPTRRRGAESAPTRQSSEVFKKLADLADAALLDLEKIVVNEIAQLNCSIVDSGMDVIDVSWDERPVVRSNDFARSACHHNIHCSSLLRVLYNRLPPASVRADGAESLEGVINSCSNPRPLSGGPAESQ